MQEQNTTAVIFSQTLRRSMGTADLTQVELAGRIGVTQAAVSKWLNGTIPKGDQLLALATALGVSMEMLLTGSGATPRVVSAGNGRLNDAIRSAETLARRLRDAESELSRLRSFLG